MMKNVQHIKTIFPIGRRDESKVCTTSFRPGALLMTRRGRRDRNRRNTLKIPNILGLEIEQKPLKLFVLEYMQTNDYDICR